MTVRLLSDEKTAETSSKGNQEKWYDSNLDSWYKLDSSDATGRRPVSRVRD
jgi:hypothetical protein